MTLKRSFIATFFGNDKEHVPVHTDHQDTYLDHLNRSDYGKFQKITNKVCDSCDLELVLPPIVLIGEESSGKSSTCARIVGYNLFPRNENICTRTPVKYQLTNLQEGDDFISINNTIFTFGSGVVQYINEWMNENVGAIGIGEKELVVKVYSKSVPTITFIDLPGIVLFDVHSEDSTSISEVTTRIVEKYISNEDTLIVAIVPARDIKNRLRSSVALNLVDKYEARDRTFCAITKVDTTEDLNYKKKGKKTPYHEIIDKLTANMTSCPPYVGLINTDTTHINELSITDANRYEHNILKTYFAELQCHFGIEALMQRLITFALTIIRNRWIPKTLKRLHTLIGNKKNELLQLGDDPHHLNIDDILSGCVEHLNRSIIRWSSVYLSSDSINSIISSLFSKDTLTASVQTGFSTASTDAVQQIIDKHRKIQRYLSMPKDIFNTLCEFLFNCINDIFLSSNILPLKISRFETLHQHIIMLFKHFFELKIQTTFVTELSQSIISFKQMASLSGDNSWNWVNLDICIRNSAIEWLLIPTTQWVADVLCPVLLRNYLNENMPLEENDYTHNARVKLISSIESLQTAHNDIQSC